MPKRKQSESEDFVDDKNSHAALTRPPSPKLDGHRDLTEQALQHCASGTRDEATARLFSTNSTEPRVLQQYALIDHAPGPSSYSMETDAHSIMMRPSSPLSKPTDISFKHQTKDCTRQELECPAPPVINQPHALSVKLETSGILRIQQSSISVSIPSQSSCSNHPVPPISPAVCDQESVAHQSYEKDHPTSPPFIHTSTPAPQHQEPSLVRPADPDWLPPVDYLTFELSNDIELELEDKYDEEEYSVDRDPPIYKGAPITLNESLVSILTVALKFSLSGMCIQALLKLLVLHSLKEGNVMKSSLYLFKKYFSHLRGAVDYEYYCSKCFSKCEKSTGCQICVGVRTQLCCLIKIPLVSQLQTMMKRKGFYAALDFKKKPASSSGLADIHDGQLYQDHAELGFFDNEDTLTTNWYTDGAALFKSSKISVWPMYHSINEVPYKKRFHKENLLVSAIWCGPVQPHGNILMNSIYPDLVQLKNGVDVDIEGKGVKKIKVIVLAGTGDTPARSLMLNMVKHNGEFSCQKCEQKGETREGCPGVRVFPFRPEEMTARTDKTLVRYGQLARVTGNAYMGVKGSTLLTKIAASAVRGTAIDSMHLLFSGIGKTNIKFFVDPSFHKQPYNVGKPGRGLIDEQLLSIKPPHYLTRVPKSLEEFALWKTSLHKSMLLYFSLPVLEDLVPDLYFRHYASLVAAVYFLNSDNVTNDCSEKADLLLTKYVSYFEDLYGREYMTLTLHLLLHLAQLVKETGPLWITACFALEGVNGEILDLVHGTKHAERQINSSLQMCLGLRDLVDNLNDGPCKEFCENLLTSINKLNSVVIGDFTIIGPWKPMSSVPEYLKKPLHDLKIEETGLFTFDCLRIESNLYVAQSYTRSPSRDSSCVQFTSQGSKDIGIIKFFVRSASCACQQCTCNCKLYAVIEKLVVVGSFKTLVPDLYVPNVHKVERSNVCLILPVSSLGTVCVKMDLKNKLTIAKRCNSKEIE